MILKINTKRKAKLSNWTNTKETLQIIIAAEIEVEVEVPVEIKIKNMIDGVKTIKTAIGNFFQLNCNF